MLRIALLCLLAANVHADNWPQWRGPKNDGHSSEAKLPTTWSADKNITWKIPLPGPGSSTPCIWGDRIFLTAQTATEVLLLCYDTAGKELWRKPMGTGSFKTMRDEGGNLASASCSTDGERVYAMVGSGKLAAYDFDGKELWSLNTPEQQSKGLQKFNIQFGAHWTPALHKGVLYVTLLDRKAQNLLAVDAKTGAVNWKAERKSDSPPGVESPDVYASPFIWSNGDQELLIVHGNDYCTAHKLTDGSEVWRVTEINPKASYNRHWRAVSSPLVTPELIVVPSCKSGVTVGIDPSLAKGTINPGNAAEKWRHEKNTPDVPSPILVDGLLYIMSERGTIYCYEAQSGKPIYKESITNMRHRANPVFADGKLYLQGRDGVLVVVKAGRTFELLAKNELPDTFTASPAISNGVIYLRGWKDLYAIK